MATVYRAHDRMLDRDVALKVLGEHLAGEEELVERFRQEAQSVAPLSHENIVAVYDRGRSAEGYYYIAMEYVPGGTLKSCITRSGHLSYGAAVEVGRQVAEALRTAHGHGIVHRDVKPHNILLTGTGTVKVADFGIAQSPSDGEAAQESLVFGTVRYMSPEQARGEALGPQSDLYSLGVVLYEALTGRVPFDAESPVAVAMKHVIEDPRPAREVNPEVPQAMSAVVARLLEKDPADRYPDADGLLEDLERLRAAPSAAERFPLSGGAASGEGGWRRYARRAAAAALVVAVAFAGTADWSLPQSGPAPTAAAVEGPETEISAPRLPETEDSAPSEAETDQASVEESATVEPDEPAASGAGEQEPEDTPSGSGEPGGSAVPEGPTAAEPTLPAARSSREPVPEPASEPVPEPAPEGGAPVEFAPVDPAPSGGAPGPESVPEAEGPGAVADNVPGEPGEVPIEEAPEPLLEPAEQEPLPDVEPEAPEVEAGEPELEVPVPGGREVAPSAADLLSPERQLQPETETPVPEAPELEVPQPEVPQPEVPQPEVPEPGAGAGALEVSPGSGGTRDPGPESRALSPGPDGVPGPSGIEVGPGGALGEDAPGPGSLGRTGGS
ncbi:MAG: protein kinase [Rubrobacter sp.]|nr:protein kinase [Rubrobacter sp.]